MAHEQPWYKADAGQVHSRVLQHVQRIEQNQSDMFDRFVKLACMYDPSLDADRSTDRLGTVTENVIASNVDTVTAAIAATDVRARFMTDDGDWDTQRRARHLEWYANGLATELSIADKCRAAFKSAAIKGTGLVKVTSDKWDQICVEQVEVDDIIVDETTVRGGKAREMHQRSVLVAEDLIAMYPKHRKAIERAAANGTRTARLWAEYRPIGESQVVFVESWILPVGVKGKPGYRAGRHVGTVDGADLFDEEWTKPCFPFAVMRWSSKLGRWYGIGGAERIAGHQRVISKGNWQIDRLIDQFAVPTTYVRLSDANLAVKQSNRLGTIAVYKGEIPKTIHPPAVSPEVYQRTSNMKSSAFEEFGVSRMAAQSMKPAGLDSGVALREYRDQTTQRFAMQEKAYEQLVLDTIWLLVDVCKELGTKAPTIMRRSRFGAKRLTWSKVDMRDVRVQICAASTLPRTPAGRIQTVLEWAQAGIISTDESRRLLQHPDLDRAMSLYTAAIENIELCLDEIADGAILMPEPFQNMALVVWRGQQEYLIWRDNNAPEEKLEALRQFVVQAAYMIDQAATPAQDNIPADPAMAGGMPADMPMPGAAAPPMETPTAALASQAMNLRAV